MLNHYLCILEILLLLSIFSISNSLILTGKIIGSNKYIFRYDNFDRISSKELITSPSLSLDKALIPSPNSGSELLISMSLIAFTLLMTSISLTFRYLEESSMWNTIINKITKLKEFVLYASKLTNTLKSIPLISKIFYLTDRKKITSSEWKTCKFKKQVQLNNELSLYRFQCDKSFLLSELSLGQQITLCSTDSKGRVLKENFFPFSFSKGSFDVLASSSSANKVLLQLEPDDEVAYKKGKVQLKYVNEEDDDDDDDTSVPVVVVPIDSVSVVTSGVGIAPTLSVLSRILSDAESAVETIEVLWINEKKEDFVLNDLMEDLEDRYPDKLIVARVVDRQYLDIESAVSDKLRDALDRYRGGRMAMAITSNEVQEKTCEMLRSLGFPLGSSVVSIVV